ncbi:putative ATP-dependent helicase [Lachnellula suecica]|uniref:Putative ATP-dependent helicase n=1 Tax=Lachnellula suecica TaxID=602035 RepID=A0A8T9BUB5_9HELO|nr:putative ATP-dependent helicase [Lachnellula suecica]
MVALGAAAKKQKLQEGANHQTKTGQVGRPGAATAVATWESSFSFTNTSAPHSPTVDISKLIPVGCLRIYKSDCAIPADAWESCDTWSRFAAPSDPAQPGGRYLAAGLQTALFRSPRLSPFLGLHNAGWIRMEFKSQEDYGQARMFLLPGDVGRASIDRKNPKLRSSMRKLLAQLDTSRATWIGKWLINTPIVHVESGQEDDVTQDDESLFHLFNTLPSPNPDPEAVSDPYAKYAMSLILESEIEGLKTTMYCFQRRSAAMMLQRELEPGQTVDPRLECLEDQRGLKWYKDSEAGSCLIEPRNYEAPRGGILAETMGLGKTLICLGLILATRDIPSKIPVEYSVGTIPVRKSTGSLKDMAAAAVGRTGTPWKNHFSDLKGGYTHDQCVDAIKRNPGHYFLPSPTPRRESSRNPVSIPPRKIYLTAATVVIVPANLFQQWRHEINKHTTGLKCLAMDDSKKSLPSPEELADFDIILFTKARFEQEAKDGSDSQGRRRTTTSTVCQCPYIADTRIVDCTCFREDGVYQSPLKSLHFKRLITDEGHTFGNSSRGARTTAVTVVDFLQLDARWIASGTPTQGLYGADIAPGGSNSSSTIGTPLSGADQIISDLPETFEKLSESSQDDTASASSTEQARLYYIQERKDLEKLGNIASIYLKARPWAPSLQDKDSASWQQYVMLKRHGSKSRGSMECLRTTLSSMMIRHPPEVVERDVQLPPLYHNVVHLEGSLQDTLSLNTFSMMIVSNAVTSERKDADYLFHPRQRQPLQELVSNLRQASFFWSGYKAEDISVTMDIAKQFLEKREVAVSPEDELLLKQAIDVGEVILKNRITKAVRELHEMPMYVDNEAPEDVRLAWALDEEPRNPTLMGATMIHEAQKFVESHLWQEDPMEGMIAAGHKSMRRALLAQSDHQTSSSSNRNNRNGTRVATESAPALAGGVAIGDSSSPKKRSSSKSLKPVFKSSLFLPTNEASTSPTSSPKTDLSQSDESQTTKPKSALKKTQKADIVGTLDASSPLASASIVSTASAKLSYLLDGILLHQQDEKILVFYEADNVAYYIAQALECLGVKHLIYAKSLDTARRSQYVVTFNQTEIFRVLLMDVSQAAFGLDMSSASRVYFVNPVFSPQVEAQAVKRAHRIGQTKPVYVETLVLKGSIEELILERRKNMSNEEHNKIKNILDDQTIYDWIREVQFLPIPIDDVPGPEQMAKLATPQLVFGKGASAIAHPDEDLVMGEVSPMAKRKAKGKGKAVARDTEPTVSFKDIPNNTIVPAEKVATPQPTSYRIHSAGRTLATGILPPGMQAGGSSSRAGSDTPAGTSALESTGAPSKKRKAVAFLDPDEDEASAPPTRKVRFGTPPNATS